MKKILYRFIWLWWLFTGYRELTDLVRSHAGNWDALTPVGMERMRELGKREAHIKRVMRGIEK